MLARNGRVKEAEILIRTMPTEPDGAIWGSLLNWCLVHGHFGLGETVGKLLIQLEQEHCGRYVVLANMYAKMRDWKNVARLKKMMEEREVVKFCAWSFIEIDGDVHKSKADGKSHPQSRRVYGVLEELKRALEESSSVFTF